MRTQTFPQQPRAPGMLPHLSNGAAAPAAPQVPAVQEHTDVVHDTQFDYYGLQLADHVVVASGGCDGHVRLWVSASSPERGLGFELHQVIEAHADWVRDVAFCPTSPASRFVILASCGQDKTVVMYRKPWDQLCAETSEGVSQATEWERSVIEFAEPVWRLSWAPSGEMLVVTNAKSEVFVLREGVDFTEPWIKLPLKDFQQ